MTGMRVVKGRVVGNTVVVDEELREGADSTERRSTSSANSISSSAKRA